MNSLPQDCLLNRYTYFLILFTHFVNKYHYLSVQHETYALNSVESILFCRWGLHLPIILSLKIKETFYNAKHIHKELFIYLFFFFNNHINLNLLDSIFVCFINPQKYGFLGKNIEHVDRVILLNMTKCRVNERSQQILERIGSIKEQNASSNLVL